MSRVSELISLLWAQHPTGLTTMAPCRQCGGKSRGGGRCARCLTNELATIVGQAKANDLRDAIANYRDAVEAVKGRIRAVSRPALVDALEELVRTLELPAAGTADYRAAQNAIDVADDLITRYKR